MKNNPATRCVRWCWKSFCIVFFCQKHLFRDLIILISLIIILGGILGFDRYSREKSRQAAALEPLLSEQESVQKEELSVPEIQSHFDTSVWTPYQNTYYGFTLKYPNDWLDPVVQKPLAGAMWEQKVEFRPKQTDPVSPFEGFDVEIYSVAKVKEVSNTDEFPKLKSAELASRSDCAIIEGHLLETGNYPAEEIYIPANDACYNATLFFTNTRDAYIYTIAPKNKDGAGLAGDPAQEITSHLPEFFAMASTWDLIDIQRPKPVPPKPKITAPHPLSYKIVNGQLVCAKKNDKPSYSKKYNSRHMDMECCLDPDEYPNPWCYYDPKKYGKYL